MARTENRDNCHIEGVTSDPIHHLRDQKYGLGDFCTTLRINNTIESGTLTPYRIALLPGIARFIDTNIDIRLTIRLSIVQPPSQWKYFILVVVPSFSHECHVVVHFQ